MPNKKKIIKFYASRIEGEKVYCVKHIPSGISACFEYDTGARDAIRNEMKRRSRQLRVKRLKTVGVLEFAGSDGSSTLTLAAFLYAYYRGISTEELKKTGVQIMHKQETISNRKMEDCRERNLYSTGDLVMDTPHRMISITDDGKYIRLYLRANGVTEYLNYTPELLNLIGKPGNVSFGVSSGKRTQVWMTSRGSETRSVYLSALAYACYHMGVNEHNFVTRMPEIMNEFKLKGMEIDHVNSDIHNQCVWNLAKVTANCNAVKHERFARVKPPFYLYAAVTDGGEYRIRYGYRNGFSFGQEFHMICKTSEGLNDFLKYIMQEKIRPIFLKRGQSAYQLWIDHKKAPYYAGDFSRAATEAEKLLAADGSRFEVWEEVQGLKMFIRSPYADKKLKKACS